MTYHPATAGGPDPGLGAATVLSVVAATAGTAIVTHPGLDRGREAVLAAADLVVGNSSERGSPRRLACAARWSRRS